jgi:cysteine desulfurase
VVTPERITYLDHAATTPMRAAAIEAMLPFLGERFANPSGSHRLARDARRAVDEARDVVAAAIGCAPGEVVFTGGGTEADNAAITGWLHRHGGVPLCSAVEHHAVLNVVEHAGGVIVGVDPAGRIDLDALAAALEERPGVSIVSVMAVNNEVGTVQPLADVARLVRRLRPSAVLHTDAVQAASWLDLREVWSHVDLLSLSAHKFGGPKGVGVLSIRAGTDLAPLLQGGGQERDRRSGTHNVGGIVALAEALRLTDQRRAAERERIAALRAELVDGLRGAGGVAETVPAEDAAPGILHVRFAGVENEALLFLLDEAGVCASAASACASGAMEPSHVLAAMGVAPADAVGALRLSLGHTTTADDIDHAITAITAALAKLRR